MPFPESGNEAEGTGSPAGVVSLFARAASPSPSNDPWDEPWAGAAWGGSSRAWGGGGTRAGVEGLGLQGIAAEWGKMPGIGGRGTSAMCRTIWGFVDETRAFIRLFWSSPEPRGMLADLTCV